MSKWVYKVKQKSNSDIERQKASLVVKGHIQVEGFVYKETFSQISKIVSVRILLAISFIKKRSLYQMDVSNVFLHSDLTGEIYYSPSRHVAY